MNEEKKLLRMIQNYAFIVQETVLYLDTHPYCRQALRYRDRYARLLKEAKAKYEERYCMLTHYAEGGQDCWRWVKEPWPWEIV